MKNENEKSVSVLNDLIQTCKDGENGFKTASEHTNDLELKSLFQQYAAQRSELARELQTRVLNLGEDPKKSGSVSASLHRGWLDLKAAISSAEPHAILAECERGEDIAVKAYREALDEYVDGATRELIRRQFGLIQATHDRIKQLRDSVHYSARS
jgi:uncharacterized protein (TIGR02284 family)